MKIYLDLLFILNFSFDLLLLFSVGIVLRRKIYIIKIIIAALFGACSIFLLFIKLNSFTLFLIKMITSIIMCLLSYDYKDLRYTLKNLVYLYTISILLGGFIYFLDVQFNYKNNGLGFFNNGLGVNMLALIIISPLIIYSYVKQALELKLNYSNYYEVDLYLKNGYIKNIKAFLDTGNQLVDPYKKRPVILLNKMEIGNIDDYKVLYVPYDTVDTHGLLKCIVVDKIYIIGVGVKENVIAGIMNEKIKIDGVDCILHTKLLEAL